MLRQASFVPPVAPYLWQKSAQTAGLPANAQSGRLNVLGFLSCEDNLHSFPTRHKVTAQNLSESIEALLPALERLPVIVMDNASMYRDKVGPKSEMPISTWLGG